MRQQRALGSHVSMGSSRLPKEQTQLRTPRGLPMLRTRPRLPPPRQVGLRLAGMQPHSLTCLCHGQHPHLHAASASAAALTACTHRKERRKTCLQPWVYTNVLFLRCR